MSYIGIIFLLVILGGIFQAIASFFSSLKGATKQAVARIAVDTSKSIVERNHGTIQEFLNEIYAGGGSYYVDNEVRDCIVEIAKKEGREDIAPAYREWLSNWQIRSDIPQEYLQLNGYLKDVFSTRHKELVNEAQKENEQKRQMQERQRQAYEDKTARNGQELFERNKTLIDKFLEITERKVSVIDDYGDENWEVLPKEILACIKKIAQRENDEIDWQEVKRQGDWSLSAEYRWLKVKLEETFKEFHTSQKNKSARMFSVDGLSGVEFEAWVAKFLKENGFSDVCGTPATGDQGADLIAKKDGKIIVIQAKRYQGSVGNKAVQEVISALGFYGGDEGWVVTNSTFTSSAKALAHKMGIKLFDGREIEKFGERLVS